MKRILTIGHVALCLLLISCEEEFLHKTDPTQIGAGSFYQDRTQVEQALNGVYGQLQGIVSGQWVFNELPSDNTTVHYNPDDRGQGPAREAFEFMTVNSGTGNIEGLYNSYYNAIFNINNTLARLQDAPIDEAVKGPIEGQLKFIRAYYYFNLVQYFGDVVIITEPLDKPSAAWVYLREPQAKVYELVESDLKEAATLLPESYDAANAGRATKGAALALLGKVYLTKKQYADAVTTLNQVLPLGYALLPSYADVFDPQKKNHAETIFDIQYQGGNDLQEHSNFIYEFAPRLSAGAVTGFPDSRPGGWNTPTKDMIAAFEEGDLRKDVSLQEGYTNESGEWVPVPYINKYNHPHTISGRTDDNWPVIRYADVLLMLAEALAQQGNMGEAANYLNMVRNRAGLADYSGSDLLGAIYHERRVELAFENHRWFDLKRTMTPEEMAQFLNAYTAREKADPTVGRGGIPYANNDYIFEPYETLYPIPNRQILINSKLTQNPGY